MTFSRFGATAAVAITVVLASCSNTPTTTITAEPTFDKYGGASCRPADQQPSTLYPERLPECDEVCENPEQFPGTYQEVICPPDVDRQPDPTRTPDESPSDPDPNDPGRDPQTTPDDFPDDNDIGR